MDYKNFLPHSPQNLSFKSVRLVPQSPQNFGPLAGAAEAADDAGGEGAPKVRCGGGEDPPKVRCGGGDDTDEGCWNDGAGL